MYYTENELKERATPGTSLYEASIFLAEFIRLTEKIDNEKNDKNKKKRKGDKK